MGKIIIKKIKGKEKMMTFSISLPVPVNTKLIRIRDKARRKGIPISKNRICEMIIEQKIMDVVIR